MNPNLQPIETRVSRSLERLGFDSLSVVHLGDGHIELRGEFNSGSDRAQAIAGIKSVTGVAKITVKATEESQTSSRRS